MKHIAVIIFLSAFIFGSATLQAQEHGHAHERNEIGLSGGAIYSFSHNAWGEGIHAHYFRTLKPHGKWSLGGGVEQVWADGSHFTLAAGVKYQITERLSTGLLPGITFFGSDDEHEHTDSNVAPSMHFELVYDLVHFKDFHAGPTFDFSLTKGDPHCMLGIHAAYCF